MVLETKHKRQLLAKLRRKTIAIKQRSIDAVDTLETRKSVMRDRLSAWPKRHVPNVEAGNVPVAYHIAQELASDAKAQVIAMIAGSQGGKTVYGPQWLWEEIQAKGAGDYLAVTSTNKLFRNKMLPSLNHFFITVLGIGRHWSSAGIIELADPETGIFGARFASEHHLMWGRIILVSAESKGGLESATAKAAWLDEAGQDNFTLRDWQAVKRRMLTTKGRILITTTLYNLGWLRTEIIEKVTRDPARESGVHVFDLTGSTAECEWTYSETFNIFLVQFDSIINPAVDVGMFLAARVEMDSAEFAMFYQGRIARSNVQVISCYSERRHLIARFPIPRTWKRYLGVDPGSVNFAALELAMEPRTKKLYFIREYMMSDLESSEHAANLLEGGPGFKLVSIGQKAEEQWRRDLGAAGLHGVKPKIHDYAVGVARVYRAFAIYRVQIFDDLVLLQDELGRYRYDVDPNGRVLRTVKNRNRFHLIDCCRYILPHLVTAGRRESHESVDPSDIPSVPGHRSKFG